MFKSILLLVSSLLAVQAKLTGLDKVSVTAESAFCLDQQVGEGTGQQQPNGGNICVSTVQGLIPEATKMVSTMITVPASSSKVSGAQGFKVEFQTTGLQTGNTLDLKKQYLLSPQTVDATTGLIEGHQQLSIQKIDNLNNAPQANKVAFFQSLDAVAVDNKFTVNVPAGAIKSKGLHRICTMAAAAGGQPVIMPVAQSNLFQITLGGAQDDCIRVTVI